MIGQIVFSKQAEKEIKKLSKSDQERILKLLYEKVCKRGNPLELAKRLTGAFSDFFRFRVGDYKILFKVDQEKITLLILKIAHRREVYKD